MWKKSLPARHRWRAFAVLAYTHTHSHILYIIGCDKACMRILTCGASMASVRSASMRSCRLPNAEFMSHQSARHSLVKVHVTAWSKCTSQPGQSARHSLVKVHVTAWSKCTSQALTIAYTTKHAGLVRDTLTSKVVHACVCTFRLLVRRRLQRGAVRWSRFYELHAQTWHVIVIVVARYSSSNYMLY